MMCGCVLFLNETQIYKQSREYFIGRSYKNDEFDWPFDLVIVTKPTFVKIIYGILAEC